MKRLLVLLLVAVMAFSLFACAQTENNNNDITPPKDEEASGPANQDPTNPPQQDPTTPPTEPPTTPPTELPTEPPTTPPTEPPTTPPTEPPTTPPTEPPTTPPTEPPTEPPTTPPTEPPTEPAKEYSILFIGNSYTYYNSMPTQYFKKLAEKAGVKLNVTAITNGGHYLIEFADPTDTYGKKVERALTGTKKYDYVILQEQSVRPAGTSVAKFYDAVRDLVARIRATGAEPILYSTWGRKTGNSTLSKYEWTNETMTWRLAASYEAIGKELDIEVAHVGLAFFDVYTNNTSINLYNSDKSHPSENGSHLAAATLVAKIFGVDPRDLASNQTEKVLFQAAYDAVFATPAIPAEYKIDSSAITEKS